VQENAPKEPTHVTTTTVTTTKNEKEKKDEKQKNEKIIPTKSSAPETSPLKKENKIPTVSSAPALSVKTAGKETKETEIESPVKSSRSVKLSFF